MYYKGLKYIPNIYKIYGTPCFYWFQVVAYTTQNGKTWRPIYSNLGYGGQYKL